MNAPPLFPGLVLASATGVFLCSCASVKQNSAATTSSWKKSSAEKKMKVHPRKKGKRQLVRTTAYSHEENEPGACGRKNAIGTTLRYGKVRSAAADWSRYPLGTRFRIVGKPHVYEIDDYGSALVGTNTIDIYKPNLRLMNEWGVRHVEIEILEWGCYDKSARILEKRTRYSHCRDMYQCIKPGMRRVSTNPFGGRFFR